MSDFSVDSQYTLTLKEPDGRLRPASLCVYRLHDDCMIARRTRMYAAAPGRK